MYESILALMLGLLGASLNAPPYRRTLLGQDSSEVGVVWNFDISAGTMTTF